MTLRILYFVLGGIFTCLVVGSVLLWDSHREFRIESNLKKGIKSLFLTQSNVTLTSDDLVGNWEGKESWGITYTISRKADGTFSQVTNLKKSDVYNSASSPFIKSTGRWTFAEGKYAYHYTQSSDPDLMKLGPWIHELSAESRTEFSYTIGEGNQGYEHKLH